MGDGNESADRVLPEGHFDFGTLGWQKVHCAPVEHEARWWFPNSNFPTLKNLGFGTILE